jgi:large subunit ribosomal protein L13
MSKEITIDAKGQRLGRVATATAALLMGKSSRHFAKNVVENVTIKIINASKLDISERKLTGTTYVRYSGYPGGLKRENLKSLSARRGYAEALRIAVRGMLPGNKLRTPRLKRLTISE